VLVVVRSVKAVSSTAHHKNKKIAKKKVRKL
jgi:hypothetical protein